MHEIPTKKPRLDVISCSSPSSAHGGEVELDGRMFELRSSVAVVEVDDKKMEADGKADGKTDGKTDGKVGEIDYGEINAVISSCSATSAAPT